MPDTSAERSRAAPNPSTGATATKRTTIPIPPSHWVMQRQNWIDRVGASMSCNRVAPVVVKPLIASKVALIGSINVPSTRYGVPPNNAASIHANVTETSTSRFETNTSARLEAARDIRKPRPPIVSMAADGIAKLTHDPSRYTKEINSGTSMATPNARITPALTLIITL